MERVEELHVHVFPVNVFLMCDKQPYKHPFGEEHPPTIGHPPKKDENICQITLHRWPVMVLIGYSSRSVYIIINLDLRSDQDPLN